MGKRNGKKASKVRTLGKLLAMLPVSCTLLYPIYLAAQLDVRQENYASTHIPQVFEGLKIAFVSDIHYGTFLKEDRVRKLVDTVNDMQPDLILLGGDYGETSQGAVEFFRLRPAFQARLGIFAVMGNHDRTMPESNLAVIQKEMQLCGIRPLVNDAIVLRRDGKSMAIAGVDDFYNGYPDLEKVALLCKDADFTLLLSHSPDLLPETYLLPRGPFYQLALCGHTHGGQVSLFGHALKSSSEYGDRFLSGWYCENGVDILVSNGVGTSLLPVRLGARPQIHLITLHSK